MSEFSEYVEKDALNVKSEEFQLLIKAFLEFIENKNREQRILKAMGKIFKEIELKDKIVSDVVMNPHDYNIIRSLATTIYDEASYQDVKNSGIFGYLWTADLRVSKKASEMKAYSSTDEDQNKLKQEFPECFPKRKEIK